MYIYWNFSDTVQNVPYKGDSSMPMNWRNAVGFQDKLYGGTGLMKKVLLFKRDNDQAEGTIRKLILYRVRRSRTIKQGQPIDGEESSDFRTIWHIPLQQLLNVGVQYINVLDRIVELTDQGGNKLDPPRWWQPESDTVIETKYFGREIDIYTKSVNPNPNDLQQL